MAAIRKKIGLEILTMLYRTNYLTQPTLAKLLNVTKQKLDYHVKKLSAEGLINIVKRHRFNELAIASRGIEAVQKNLDPKDILYSKFLTTFRTENHQLMVKCFHVDWGYVKKHGKEVSLKKSKYYLLGKSSNPFNTTLKFHTNGTLVIYTPKMERTATISELKTVETKLFALLAGLFEWLRKKQIAFVEIETLTEKYLEIANKASQQLDMVSTKQQKIIEFLGRPARGFFSQLNVEAKVWIDKSYDYGEIETNDMEYERKLLLMPEFIYELSMSHKRQAQSNEKFAKNLELHYNALIKIGNGVDELSKNVKTFTVLLERMSQQLHR